MKATSASVHSLVALLGLVGAGALGAACGDNGAPIVDQEPQPPPPPPPAPELVTVNFKAMVDDQLANCDQIYNAFGPEGNGAFQFQDFRFYVHAIEFLTAEGDAVPLAMADELPWQNDGLALLDFEDQAGLCANGTPELRSIVTGERPAGTYTGIRFTLGVPFEKNHQDASTAAAPLNFTSLFWNWQGGYKFARIDVSTEPTTPDGPRAGFNIHIGSTGCDGSPAGGVTACSAENRAVIELPLFDVNSDAIAINYRALVGSLDLGVNGGGAPGCMSGATDPECPVVFASLGLAIADNTPNMTAFSVEADAR